jgi:hypothetical protein
MSNGRFVPGESCSIPECRKGCCIIGSESKWTTENNCEWEGNTENLDIPTQWLYDENHDSELKCLFSVERAREGACIFDVGDERKCTWTTLEECVARTGSESSFDREGRFCSDPDLNTVCKPRDRHGCFEDREDVYWFDSCGNPEDVYNDCDLFAGTFCREISENQAECRDMSCSIDGKIRKHGESWCEYDGSIGTGTANPKDAFGRDPVGSRHMRHICYMGSERIEPCADYRNEICVQQDTDIKGSSFSEAACRVNEWRSCFDISAERENVVQMEQECNKNPDCFIKHIDMGSGFNFKLCVPKYPPGFDLGGLSGEVSGESDGETKKVESPKGSTCDVGTQQCVEEWVCGLIGCICVSNCDCHTSKFTEKMNELCVSLGDCGGYVNYAGECTGDGYMVDGAPRISCERYNKNAEPNPSQKPADPGDIEFITTLHPEAFIELSDDAYGNLSSFEREVLQVAGAMGSPLLLKVLGATEGEDVLGNLGSIRASPVNLGGASGSAGSAKARVSSQIVYEGKNLQSFSSIGALAAGIVTALLTKSVFLAPIASVLANFLFQVWTERKYIDFTCSEWNPPVGGDKCNECNQLDSPCTEYRCHSLGQLCRFVNKGTGNELCIADAPDPKTPEINPLLSVISEGFEYKDVTESGFTIANSTDADGCIPGFSSVNFGITVEPFARCRFGFDPLLGYEEMTQYFGFQGNSVLPVHRMDLFFPTPEAFKNHYNLTEEQIRELGRVSMYLKCRTSSGKINPDIYRIQTCVSPGPDFTAPRIIVTDPQNNAFLSYGVDEINARIFVNEPSECKWAVDDKNFEDMENTISCETSLDEYTRWGLPCNATFKNLQNNSKFNIRCRDTSENQNVMKESFVYELVTSKEPLIISDFEPDDGDTVTAGFEPVSVKLRLQTDGGAEDGVAMCNWTGNGYWDDFRYQTTLGLDNVSYEVGARFHDYTLGSTREGRYDIEFACMDIAGNMAVNSTSFRVKVDSFGPKITRMYFDTGLKIFTAENAECRYSFNRNFKFDNASAMSGDGTEHFAEWQIRNYYIQCEDDFKNKGGIVKIKPYQVL